MNESGRLIGVLAAMLLAVCGCGANNARVVGLVQFDVRELPPVAQPVGGAFSGLANDTLVLAGGSYFVAPPPAGKTWADRVFKLSPKANAWADAGRLERPLAYGAAVSTPRGLVLAGGCDAERHYDSVLCLTITDGRVQLATLPSLPQPAAYLEGALIANHVYVAGGRSAPQSPQALRTFWTLDLDHPEQGWRELEPWPGPARMLSCVLAQDGAIYVISGAELLPGADTAPDTAPVRRYLTDAYRYRPDEGWKRIADLPHAVVAAPAVAWGSHHLLVFGGDNGSLAAHGASLGDAHPGFNRALLAYDTVADTWTKLQEMPPLPVTTHASVRGKTILIPTGEDRPGHRTPAVLAIEPRTAD